MTETEFLKARLNEMERKFEGHVFDYTAQDSGTSFCRHPSHIGGWSSTCARAFTSQWILAEIAAQRKIIEIQEAWPILVESQPEFDTSINTMAMQMSQKIAWMTNQKFREAFGIEPPTTQVIRALIQPFSSHPDFQESWMTDAPMDDDFEEVEAVGLIPTKENLETFLRKMLTRHSKEYTIRRTNLIPANSRMLELQNIFFILLNREGLAGAVEQKGEMLTFTWKTNETLDNDSTAPPT